MEVKPAPVTPILFAEKLALPKVDSQDTGLYTPTQHRLPGRTIGDTTKAKLMQICEDYISKR
jgi:hypothetical protein